MYKNKYSNRSRNQSYGDNWHNKAREFKQDKRCKQCSWKPINKKHEKYLHVDHIIPLSSGGLNHAANFQVLCAKCHAIKHPENKRLQEIARQMQNDISKST